MNLPDPHSMPFSSLKSDTQKGLVKIPQFQRDFVLTKQKSAKLLDSIVKGYPIGTFIFWKTEESLRAIRNIGGDKLPDTPKGDFIQYALDDQRPDEVRAPIGSWPDIGGTFFREYLIIFKFSENLDKLERYYDNHIKDSSIQRLGLQISIYDASKIIYVNVVSLAWEDGLREGYEIISVNGIPIDSLGYFGVYDLLSDTSIEEYQFLVVTITGGMEDVIVSTE